MTLDYIKRSKCSSSSLADDLIYEVSSSCSSLSRGASSHKSNTTLLNAMTPESSNNTQDYDQIFEAYSKIWREATLLELTKTKSLPIST